MTHEPQSEGAWWLPRVRWLVLLLLFIVIPTLAVPVVRYQSVCRWVEQRGGLHADRYEIAGFTIYTNVDEVYLTRGTIDNPPTPAFLSLESGDISRLRMFPELRKLVIAGYELPVTGRREIAGLKRLRHIDVIRTNVTEEEARALFDELPECSIRFSIDGDPRNNSYFRP